MLEQKFLYLGIIRDNNSAWRYEHFLDKLFKLLSPREDMKKWAKVCVWIGIIWIVLVLIGLIIFYFQVKSLASEIQQTTSNENEYGGISSLVTIINLNTPISSLTPFFLLLGIPSWFLFIISVIWGRGKEV